MSVALGTGTRVRTARAWIELIKPSIISLVLFTGLPALLLAAGPGSPEPVVFWGALAGIVLSAASAASFNHYFDRDIDALMHRTQHRPLPTGALPPVAALSLGFALAAAAWGVLINTTNLLASVVAMANIAYYAVVYTVWLKRRTPQNIVIGGGAGASAPLIAWAAVTGRLDPPAWLLAGIIFLWTPPHFWSLSLYRRDDYARAGIPMLPVTHGEAETRRQILLYSLILVPLTLVVAPFAGLGWVYAVPAALLGGVFLALAARLHRRPSTLHAVHLFRYSIVYLFALFLMMTVDAGWAAFGPPSTG